MHQETHSNFLEFFVRKLKRTGVLVARTEVCIAKTQEKNPKKSKAHGYEAQTTQSGGSGISKMP